MKLSILVPTFNRNELLELGILSSLARQTLDKNEYEIIVLNEGSEEGIEDIVYKYQNTRYINTGKTKKEKKWRIPGYAINIGAKLALGDKLIITCPEIYLYDNDLLEKMLEASKDDKALIITEGVDDQGGHLLKQAKEDTLDLHLAVPRLANLNTDFPFFLLVDKKRFIDIGGYDEDFKGFCWDDLDIVDRLLRSGCHYVKLPNKIVHLYHSRLNREGVTEKNEMWLYNKNLYYSRVGQNIRNVGREWGQIERT